MDVHIICAPGYAGAYRFRQKGNWPKWLLPLATVNLSIILIVRIIVIMGFGFARTYGHLKSYYGFKEWAHEVKKRAGDSYVVMIEGFQNPAKYDYYTNSLQCFAYDTRYYRRTQFDIWPMEDSLQHKRIYYLSYYPINGLTTDTLSVPAGKWYGCWVNDARTYQKVNFETPVYKFTATPGQKVTFNLTVSNPYNTNIDFGNTGYAHQAFLEACFFKGDNITDIRQADTSFNKITLKPHQKTHYTFTLAAPLKKGEYDLLFSIRTDPFPGGKNSRIINFTVK